MNGGLIMPKRIQRKRTKGWRMPEGAVYVGRPTEWGNPFTAEICGSLQRAVDLYRLCVLSKEQPGDLKKPELKAANKAWESWVNMPSVLTIQLFLRDKDLACWCPLDKPCHADVLLEIANMRTGSTP